MATLLGMYYYPLFVEMEKGEKNTQTELGFKERLAGELAVHLEGLSFVNERYFLAAD